MARVVGLVLVAVLALGACGDDDEGASSGSTVADRTTTTSAPTTTTSSTTTTSTTLPTAGPVELRSTHHRYALTVDVARLSDEYDPASAPWDGVSRILRGSRYVDSVPLTGGDLFLTGLAWTEDAGSLAQMFVEHSAERNGCSEAHDLREASVGGAPAVAFTVDSCGSDGLAFARVAAVHDGFGLVAFSAIQPGEGPAAVDRLLSGLEGLTWA